MAAAAARARCLARPPANAAFAPDTGDAFFSREPALCSTTGALFL
jgi:hypothetical protein